QPREATPRRFQHAQDLLLHHGITDQLRLVDAAVLAQHPSVEAGSHDRLHMHNTGIEVVVAACSGAVLAVAVAVFGRSGTVAVPIGTAVRGLRARGQGLGIRRSWCAIAVSVLAVSADRRPVAVSALVRWAHAPPPILRHGPRRQRGRLYRLPMLIEIDPGCDEVIEVSAQAELAAGTLKRLRVRRCEPIVIVRPLLASAGVGAEAGDRYRTGNQHLAGDDGIAL